MSFICDICEKSFTQETNLVRHKKTVHGDRSLVWERCGDSFNRKDALKRHMKKHSQEKTDECQHWRRRFYRKEKGLEQEKFCEFEKQVGQGLVSGQRERWW